MRLHHISSAGFTVLQKSVSLSLECITGSVLIASGLVLGIPYDPALDIWSVGCTLYELYTGKILFPGRSNNQMLLLMMELKGRFNSKMIKKAKFGELYFDEMGGFQSVEKDRVTGGVGVARNCSMGTVG
jgi:serine/threonine protein kinase